VIINPQYGIATIGASGSPPSLRQFLQREFAALHAGVLPIVPVFVGDCRNSSMLAQRIVTSFGAAALLRTAARARVDAEGITFAISANEEAAPISDYRTVALAEGDSRREDLTHRAIRAEPPDASDASDSVRSSTIRGRARWLGVGLGLALAIMLGVVFLDAGRPMVEQASGRGGEPPISSVGGLPRSGEPQPISLTPVSADRADGVTAAALPPARTMEQVQQSPFAMMASEPADSIGSEPPAAKNAHRFVRGQSQSTPYHSRNIHEGWRDLKPDPRALKHGRSLYEGN
jgi:hypothetical protein